MYPIIRLRRNRKTPWLRELLAETSLSPADLVLPIFVVEGHNEKQEIKSMPGIYRQSIDQVVATTKQAKQAGIKAIALFPCIEQELKNETADEAYNLDNLICRTIRSIKNANIDIGVICDVALDPYTSHGHDGILNEEGDVDNDATLEALRNQALVLAKAGADIVAPSDMMDGRIMAIREELDRDGFINVNILAYAAKYASNFYAPFREALNNQKLFLDKSTYQLDKRNIKEAMVEIEHDLQEGADMIMIKPGMPFLDVINAASSNFNTNIFAYQVSGEYAMLKFASIAGVLDWEACLLEALISFKRAGASVIFTYAALEAAQLLNTQNV